MKRFLTGSTKEQNKTKEKYEENGHSSLSQLNHNKEQETQALIAKTKSRNQSTLKASNVWDFFEKSEDKKFAKCRTCNKVYKTSGNTSNLRDHIKRFHCSSHLEKHSVDLSEPETLKSSIEFGSNSNISSARSSTRSISPFFKRIVLYDKESKRKKDIDNALIYMIATDFQPFNIVNDTGFKNFVKILDPRYTLPSKTTLRDKHLNTMYIATKEKLRMVLETVKYVSVSCDSWTSRGTESYLTTTCHFINSDFELKCAVLSTKQIMHHNSEAIANVLMEIFTEWNIEQKVICITTDNAANMIKSAQILKLKHLPCYAHTLNLVVQDALQVASAHDIRAKCREIVKFFKSSTVAMDKLKSEQSSLNSESEPYKLLQEVPTRWNSTLDMIKRILLIREPLSRSLLQLKKAPAPFTAEEILIMQDMENILEIFDVATKQVSGNTYVTISLIIPITCGIYNQLYKKTEVLFTEEGKLICDKLLSSITTRLHTYEKQNIPRIATLLDPRFKKDGFFNSINANEATNFLEREMQQSQGVINYREIHENQQQLSNDKNIHKRSSLFSFLEERLSNKIKSPTANILIHKRQYFEKDNAPANSDPLLYWKMYNTTVTPNANPLVDCSIKFLCIPATSTESERVFSSTGTLISEKRSRLKSKNVDMLTFLNHNWKLFPLPNK